MSSQTKITPISVSNTKASNTKACNTEQPKKQSKSQKMQKTRVHKDLEKLRKSKRFRELGDMLYL
jgi:hypothetical protein|uniref:Uncharacterized protein n=1 Tax=viral metagenome TaxID=1070528 RepID=A0A6C0JHP6_9ZZZZ